MLGAAILLQNHVKSFLVHQFPSHKALPLSERLQNLDDEEYYFAFKVWVRVLCCAVPLTILWKGWPVPLNLNLFLKIRCDRWPGEYILIEVVFLSFWGHWTVKQLRPIPRPGLETNDERLIMLGRKNILIYLFSQRKVLEGRFFSWLFLFLFR